MQQAPARCWGCASFREGRLISKHIKVKCLYCECVTDEVTAYYKWSAYPVGLFQIRGYACPDCSERRVREALARRIEGEIE